MTLTGGSSVPPLLLKLPRLGTVTPAPEEAFRELPARPPGDIFCVTSVMRGDSSSCACSPSTALCSCASPSALRMPSILAPRLDRALSFTLLPLPDTALRMLLRPPREDCDVCSITASSSLPPLLPLLTLELREFATVERIESAEFRASSLSSSADDTSVNEFTSCAAAAPPPSAAARLATLLSSDARAEARSAGDFEDDLSRLAIPAENTTKPCTSPASRRFVAELDAASRSMFGVLTATWKLNVAVASRPSRTEARMVTFADDDGGGGGSTVSKYASGWKAEMSERYSDPAAA
mmetsp:Transcript_29573/g.50135  ORF Transcript_29573/g.50135 Transcript_29573/m.50135 type:complete len:295 (+) Transcript_29573:1465-2349(+)